eukprot:CAMPEP_0197879264 /NCGR_PEP_ID=MMETSP1439-20131203/7419_1 /TAXON_ID=66791 /ORGANISM="Gonyaulax spinifera, Strain CCMP409" /LENGTH=47 /DNA_ID= /DNA_START= /DNA_END= /DNA_ORIENTATION=
MGEVVEQMQLFVRDIAGRTVSVSADAGANVASLKDQLAAEQGVAVCE